MAGKYKRILIINTFGIGDVLFSTPMLKALKEYMPDAHIDFMCNRRCRNILQNNGDIEDLIIFEKDDFREAFRKSKVEFVKKIFAFIVGIKRKKYDLAIDLSLGYHISMLLKFLRLKKRVGFNYRKRGRFLTDRFDMDGFYNKHAIEYYLDILKLIGLNEVSEKNLELALSPEFKEWAEGFVRKNKIDGKNLVGMAPGGGKSWGKYAVYRRWDPQNFSYVAQGLSKKEENLFFLIFGSKTEKGLGQIIEGDLAGRAINLCGKLSLPRSIALIRKCRLLLCNDGGLLHIAVSQGVNTISIFGPVDDMVYGPYPLSDKHKVVKAEEVACRPCYKSFKHTMCETHDCLKKIDREKVLRIATRSLGLEEERAER